MTHSLRLFFATLIAALGNACPSSSLDLQDFGGVGQLQVRLAWREGPLRAGGTHYLGIVFEVTPRWHIQAGAGSGDEAEGAWPTTITLTLPQGWTAGATLWPEAHEFMIGTGEFALRATGYDGRTVAIVPVSVPPDVSPGSFEISATVSYQACDDQMCAMPETIGASITADVAPAGTATAAIDAAVERLFVATLAANGVDGGMDADREPPLDEATRVPDEQASPAGPAAQVPAGLLSLMLAGLAGGFILNLTPCVLPVIPLKIMGLANSAGNRRRTLALGSVMAAGVVAFWMALGVAIISISGFTSANQLFQYPWFPISIGIIIAVLSVGMCGLFSIRLPAWVYSIHVSHESFFGSFLFGVMTAVLSTPCTAPFMGAAAAAAVGQSTSVVLGVFGSIGVGMALPYLVLACFPQLVKKMPRSGPVSELIKQVMGLLMLAAAAYFIGVGVSGMLVEPPQPPGRGYFWVVFGFVAAALGWLVWRIFAITQSANVRGAFAAVGAIALAASAFGAIRLSAPDSEGPIPWVYFTPERFDEARASGKVVVIEFTAEWCLNCKLLEKSVLNSEEVSARLREEDTVAIKVDLTGNNHAGNAKLRETGSVTIPWLVIYSPRGEVVFAQNWYTRDVLLQAIDSAAAARIAGR